MRHIRWPAAGFGVVLGFALAVAGGTAVMSQAATTQQVTASLNCEPGTVKPGRSIGCVLTVANNGGNNVVKVVVFDDASGGTFLSSSSSLCTGLTTATLMCNIGKLVAGGTFTTALELEAASTGTSLAQTVSGRFSTNPNNRGSDTIPSVPLDTPFDDSPDFDGRFVDASGESVQTDTASPTNPYSTAATVAGTLFASGLTVDDGLDAVEGDVNCPPTGCFGGKFIQLSITPLTGDYPASFTMTWTISGDFVPRGTKAADIEIRHNGVLQQLCPTTDPVTGDCVVSKTVDVMTNDTTIEVTGPGSGNGDWGTG